MNCKGCGMSGTWARRGKRWAILEPNGQRHRCKRYAKKQKEPAHKVGPTTTATDFSLPSCATCPLPPWEHCACTALAAERVNAEADERFTRAMELAEQA